VNKKLWGVLAISALFSLLLLVSPNEQLAFADDDDDDDDEPRVPIICREGFELVGNGNEGFELVGDECVPIVCNEGFELVGDECVPIEIEVETNGSNDSSTDSKSSKEIEKRGDDTAYEPPTIGPSLDGVRQVVDGGIAIDGQTWTVTQGYHQEFELLQMLTSPHTISNVIHCDKGVQYCNYIAVGFMALTDDFNNPVMTVSASKDHLGDWSIDWYDPENYISDPGDVTPTDITFVPQIIDNKLLGTSFTIDFKNKDTGQLKLGIQVRDSHHGVRNFFFNEGVEFLDADAYPYVETVFEESIKVTPLCINPQSHDRDSCGFDLVQDWTQKNAQDMLNDMLNGNYIYDKYIRDRYYD